MGSFLLHPLRQAGGGWVGVIGSLFLESLVIPPQELPDYSFSSVMEDKTR